MACSSNDRLVTLRGGVVVPAESLLLALDLERRGCTLRREGDGGLLVGPGDALDDADRQSIRRLKPDLLALVAYVDAEGWRA